MIRALLLTGAALLPLVLAPLRAGAQAQDDSARAMLLLARAAFDRNRLAEGQEALERAETRLLNVGAASSGASALPAVGDIVAARQALDKRDRAGARAGIERALVRLEVPPASLPPPIALAPPPTGPAADLPPIAGTSAPETAPPPPPMVTRALRAGRWELRGAEHVWIPPETVPQRVEVGQPVPGRWVWRGDEYRWKPARVVVP